MQYWLDKMYTLYIFFSGLMGISIQDRKKFLLQVTRKDSLDDLTVCRGCLLETTRLSFILDDIGRRLGFVGMLLIRMLKHKLPTATFI